MKARRTVHSNKVFTLPGGTEDNDLWAYVGTDDNDNMVISSVWVPTDEERERIARGWNVRLNVWGRTTPPVMVDITDEPLGKKHS